MNPPASFSSQEQTTAHNEPLIALFDSHCHFDEPAFDRDRADLWRQCHALGIRQLIIPGVEPAQWLRAKKIADEYSGIGYAVGIHPAWIEQSMPQAEIYQRLSAAALASSCVAIGECGLDKTVQLPMQQQVNVLHAHLDIAQQLGKPLIIHCVKAYNELLQLLSKIALPRGGVIHGFSGSLELAQAYWRLGFYLGIGGTISYERAKKTRATVTAMPLDALLLETDAPYMPLSGQQGQRNTPTSVMDVAITLAQLREQPLATIAAQTTRNAQQLFGY